MAGVQIRFEDGVCVATLDNPEQLNALNEAVMEGLLEACARVAAEDAIRVLVLTGTGRAFSAGADIGMMNGLDSLAAARAYIERVRDVYLAIEQLPQPVIAAVNGYALGGGLELCLASNLVIAAESASFALPEIRLGAIPGFAVVRLPEVVGRLRAAELMMLGDRIDAAEAHRIGLVNRIVPAERLLSEALELAKRLAAGAPIALASIKAAMRGGGTGDDMTLFLHTASAVLSTADAASGMRAFREKREPRFEGR